MQALSVRQLTKIYAKGSNALKGIDLDVDEGDFFALLGQNGAGKSTTIGIICSLINKTSGKVSVFGHDIDTHLQAAKACIGIVPQEMNFHPFENLFNVLVNQAGYYGISRKIAEKRAEHYLNKMGLWDYRQRAVHKLSGGMKRRLMIARALMNEPKLLILDEPTAGVDIELRHSLWQYLTELNNQGTTIILTTHYLEEAEHLCKNVAIIDHGEIIAHSDMKSFINRLDSQTIVLDLENATHALPDAFLYPHQLIDPFTLEIKITRKQVLNELFAALTQQGITIKSLRNKTNRLEELFIDLIHENSDNKKRQNDANQ